MERFIRESFDHLISVALRTKHFILSLSRKFAYPLRAHLHLLATLHHPLFRFID